MQFLVDVGNDIDSVEAEIMDLEAKSDKLWREHTEEIDRVSWYEREVKRALEDWVRSLREECVGHKGWLSKKPVMRVVIREDALPVFEVGDRHYGVRLESAHGVTNRQYYRFDGRSQTQVVENVLYIDGEIKEHFEVAWFGVYLPDRYRTVVTAKAAAEFSEPLAALHRLLGAFRAGRTKVIVSEDEAQVLDSVLGVNWHK